MIARKRSTLKDLLLFIFVAGLCILLSMACKSSKGNNPVSTAEESLKSLSKKEPVIHSLKIIHPGDPKSEPIDLELVQYLDEEGNPERYSLWVDSVICRDEACEVVKVEIFWDAFGQYEKYYVEKGEDLTKLDHVPFTKEDHAKLQKILLDKESPLNLNRTILFSKSRITYACEGFQ